MTQPSDLSVTVNEQDNTLMINALKSVRVNNLQYETDQTDEGNVHYYFERGDELAVKKAIRTVNNQYPKETVELFDFNDL